MVSEIRIYYEGDRQLKPGFHEFFREMRDLARERRCSFRLIATDATPCEDFAGGIASHPDAWNILLLDSDRPDSSPKFFSTATAGISPPRVRSFGWSR